MIELFLNLNSTLRRVFLMKFTKKIKTTNFTIPQKKVFFCLWIDTSSNEFDELNFLRAFVIADISIY